MDSGYSANFGNNLKITNVFLMPDKGGCQPSTGALSQKGWSISNKRTI